MNTLTIEAKKQTWHVQIPENWDEVPLHLYPNLAQLYLKGPDRMNETDKLVRVFCLLAIDAYKGVMQMSDEQLTICLPMIYWVFENLDIQRNPLPSFVHNNIRYIGPDKELENVRFGEFCMAETFFMQYWENKDDKILDKLIATLYRPAGNGNQYNPKHNTYRGDRREKFNGNLIDIRAEKFSDLDVAIKDGIYLYYLVSRWQIFDYFPHVFPKKKHQKINTPKQKTPQYGWMGVFDDLQGERGHTAETLEDEFLHTTLLSLERGQIKFKELKLNKK
ncbi:hypothetical protein ACR79B_11245 [Sphingobacterium spiritivorum]|uniref:hypothetical protein n=1 Tax=Sphingobacterium spiritivorum TaxID=258 RepID=UPI003DA30C4E